MGHNLNNAIWLTLSRFVLLPLAILPLALGWSNGGFMAACITQLAGLTDFADGIVARRTGQTTPLGTNLDFFTDKIFIGGMLVTLAWLGMIAVWVPAVVLAREAAVAILRFKRFHWLTPSPDMLGKAKTMVSFAAIMWVGMRHDLPSPGVIRSLATHFNLDGILSLAPWLVYTAVALTVISGVNYYRQYTFKQAGINKN
jgi:CDP-diacylglycerol--glycerol-3-phosphate 3-phosphatidyltransferase